jgi:hypothetical protein
MVFGVLFQCRASGGTSARSLGRWIELGGPGEGGGGWFCLWVVGLHVPPE